MKKLILIALLGLSFSAAWGQRERVKTVEVPDSASMVVFDTIGNNIYGTNVQEAIEYAFSKNGVYTGSDTLTQDNTIVKMDASNNQTFGIGNFSDWPNIASSEVGFYVSPNYWGQIGTIWGDSGNNTVVEERYANNFNSPSFQFVAGDFDGFPSSNKSASIIGRVGSTQNELAFSFTRGIDNQSGIRITADSFSMIGKRSGIEFLYNFPETSPAIGDVVGDIDGDGTLEFFQLRLEGATCYQSTLRQYVFPTPATVDTIIIDTLTNALITDSIAQDIGYIRNISSYTMRWQISYNFFRDSDEDPLTSFIDLTVDGTDTPEAIPGSRAYSEQAVANGTQHAGQTFMVDVPPGQAIRLCVYGAAAALGVDISDLTISVEEIYRE